MVLIRDRAGKEVDVAALAGKMPELKAQLDKIEECRAQFAFILSKKENLPDFKYGPISLALHTVGGLKVLQALRLPPNIKGDAKPPMMPDLMALKYLEGSYPRGAPKELQVAVEAFNNAAFEIRGLFNKTVSVKW